MISVFTHRKYLLLLVINLMLINIVYANSDKIVKIGVVFDGPWEKNRTIWESYKDEIIALIGNEYDILFPDNSLIESDYSVNGIKKSLMQLYNDPKVDLVITMGLFSSQLVTQMGDLPKPTIAPFIVDYELQSIPYKKGKSGIKNLNYVSRKNFIEDNLLILKELVEFKKVALLFDPEFIRLLPDFENVIKNKLSKLKLQYQIINTKLSADELLSSIEDNVEAVYIDGLISFSPEKINKFVEGLKIKRLPSISATGIKDVEAGIMVAQSPSDFFMRRARRVAVNVQRILEGDDPEDIEVAYFEPKHITLNVETAKSVGVYPSWELITDIYLVGGEEKKSGPMLSLFSVVQEAINLNLDLKAREKSIQAGHKEIEKAWTNLLPNIDVMATSLQIDKDRAKASFGTQAEQTISGSLTLSQLLYSDEAWGNITIQKELQKSRENEFTQTKYDLIQETAVAYLNILRAKAYERIQKDNLKVTQTNYETAKIRESIGSAGPGEIYRWEAEVASGQQAVISATVQHEITEQALNRILGYPINRKFSTTETDLNDKRLITSKDRLFNIINNPWVYDIFSDYLAAEAVKASPEIKILDAAIAVQERYYATTGRAFWLPTIAAQAQYDNAFERYGEGSNPKSLGVTPPKDQSWSAAITASLPIFNGGLKFINRQQAYLELQKLITNRESLRQKIVQQTHYALKNSRYSGAKIRLSKKAAESARKNLEIILDAYKNGAVSIIELLDAQNAMLVTDQVAANAEFDFLIDIMNVERAIGRFDFFISDIDQEAWIDKFEAYYHENMRK